MALIGLLLAILIPDIGRADAKRRTPAGRRGRPRPESNGSPKKR
jgi:hypothetical protein